MCTVTVDIDEDVIRDMRPELDNPAAIRRWAQQLINRRIQEMELEDAGTVDLETAREIIH